MALRANSTRLLNSAQLVAITAIRIEALESKELDAA